MRRLVVVVALAGISGCGDADVAHRTARLDCNGCHAQLYDARPDHVDGGVARTCYACHGTARWSRAVRGHAFPLDRAPHAGWDCADCHVGDTDAVSCVQCHSHSEGRTGPLHLGVGGYTWEPRSCLACHGSDGRGR